MSDPSGKVLFWGALVLTLLTFGPGRCLVRVAYCTSVTFVKVNKSTICCGLGFMRDIVDVFCWNTKFNRIL